MSADNGIYILKTEGPEYRVAYHMAVENLYWKVTSENPFDGYESDNSKDWIVNAREMWKYSPVFTNKDDAWKYAGEKAEEIEEEDYYLEYGVSMLEIHEKF